MTEKRSFGTLPQTCEIIKRIRDDHRHIMALFQLYLAAADDARYSIVNQILHHLASHLEREEELLYGEIKNAGDQGRRMVEEALLEHEEVKAMMYELQHSEGDDDQALDEFFEDMMQTVRAHFIAEERDMLPLAEVVLSRPPA